MKKFYFSFVLLLAAFTFFSCSTQKIASNEGYRFAHKDVVAKELPAPIVKDVIQQQPVEEEMLAVSNESLIELISEDQVLTQKNETEDNALASSIEVKSIAASIAKTIPAQLPELDQNQEISKTSKQSATADTNKPKKDQWVALILCFFLGNLGIHRFYLGYTTIGIIQLLTAGGCGVWTLIDFIMILTGKLKPKKGKYGKKIKF